MAVGILITADEVKELNSISGSTTYDYQIDALIPIVTDFIFRYCNLGTDYSTFVDESGSFTTYTYDTYDFTEVALKLPAAQLIWSQVKQPEKNISSETVGGYSVSFIDSIPKMILNNLNIYRKVKYF